MPSTSLLIGRLLEHHVQRRILIDRALNKKKEEDVVFRRSSLNTKYFPALDRPL